MKIASAQIDNYISRIASEKIAGCLLFGQDQSLITYRFDLIAKKICSNLSDPFLVANLSKERIGSDKSSLSDEFFSLPFFGNRKLILIKDCDSHTASALQDLFSIQNFQEKSENFILIHAGDLDKSSVLRKACEINPYFAAIACYEDSEYVVKKFVENELSRNQVKSDSQAIDYFLEKCGKNRQIILLELEKIFTFLGEEKNLSVEIIDKLVNSTSEIAETEFVINFASKKFDTAILKAEKLLNSGVEAVTLIRFLINYLQKVYHAKIAIHIQKIDFEEAVKAQYLFFKMEADFRKHLKTLDMNFISGNLYDLEKLEIQAKSAVMNPKILLVNFLQTRIKN